MVHPRILRSACPTPHSPTLGTWVFAKLTDVKETWLQQRGGILIHAALEAKFLSWPWRVGVELLPSSAAVPLAQGTPKSICCAMGGLGGWRDLTSNRLKAPPRCSLLFISRVIR